MRMNFRRLKHCQFLHCLCQRFLFGCLSFLLQFSGFANESTHELLRLFIVGEVELFTLPSDLFCLLESSFVLPARQRVPQTLLERLVKNYLVNLVSIPGSEKSGNTAYIRHRVRMCSIHKM